MAGYLGALAAGDLDASVAAFRARRLCCESRWAASTHGGPVGLSACYGRLFSTGGGIPLESCAVVDDGRGRALQYLLVRWGTTRVPPPAGVAVFVPE